jgi:glutamine synthetase
MKLEELRAMIDSNNIESIDIKYSDLVGNWYHLGIPVTRLEWLLENGVPFDSSSVPGMRSVESGDMLLFPDPSTAIIDPFTRSPTLRMLSFICDAETRTGVAKDPRSLARRAHAYLEGTGIADQSRWIKTVTARP